MNNKNLKPFKKGQSGNPAGKAPGTLSMKTIIRKWLDVKESIENPVTGLKESLSQADIIILKQIAKARKGDSKAFELLKNHIESPARKEFDVSGSLAPEPITGFIVTRSGQKQAER